MGLYRCYNCDDARGLPGADFEAPRPACPECGAGPPTVVERAVIHFDPPSGMRGRGSNDAACSPAVRVGPAHVHMTGHPAAVTCPACKGTDLYRDAAEATGEPVVPGHLDVPVTLDPALHTVTAPAGGDS